MMVNCLECNKEFKNERALSNHMRGGCRSQRKYERNCPICSEIIKYYCPSKLQEAMDKNTKCNKCGHKGREVTKETKEKISNKLKLNYENGYIPNMIGAHSKESREKMGNTRRGKKLSQYHKDKIKISINNSELYKLAMSLKERGDKISKKLKGRIPTEETKNKMKSNHADIRGDKNPFYNKKHTTESKNIIRYKLIERIESNLLLYGKKIMPFFNKRGCDYFDKLMLETNCNIQHALNGGEFYIKGLGYFLDGYDKENNVAYEWDESQHFDADGNLIESDVIRQKQIEELLRCKFIRIKQSI